MSPEVSQEIVEDVRKFLREDTKKSYRDRGIPWRRGLLFHGPPGTGKTSFCRILASIFAVPIYIINLASVDDDAFQELFCTMPDGCIVLLEDIDAAGIQNRDLGNEASEQKVSLATVLNAFDGIGTHTGHLLVVTTNKKLSLDPALTRPGRIDGQYEFGYLNASTIKSFFFFFFHTSSPNATVAEEIKALATYFSDLAPHEGTSPAALQEYFLQCNNDPQVAIANAHILWKCSENTVKSFSILSINTIDNETSRLQKNNETGQFTGGAIIYGYHPDDPSTPYVLVLQCAPNGIDDIGGPKPSSWPNVWGVPAGGHSPKNSTLLKSIVRETYEETRLKLWSASDRVYRVPCEDKGPEIAKYFIIARTREKVNCRRIWSDDHREPRGSDERPIHLSPLKHRDYCWVSMKQVQDSPVYHLSDAGKGRLAMLESEKKVLVDFFARLKDGYEMEYPLPDLELPENE